MAIKRSRRKHVKRIRIIAIIVVVLILIAMFGVLRDIRKRGADVNQQSQETTPVTDTSTWTEMDFTDVAGRIYQMAINPGVPVNPYTNSVYTRVDGKLTYEDDNYTSRFGIDVSSYQGDIDWQKVADFGVQFAFIRVGVRGYGQEGNIKADDKFIQNIQGAQAAGIDVGVYFFAQAVDEEEAREEARYVLDAVKDYKLQLPIVYDPESILHDESRTDNVTGEQFTKNTVAFLTEVQNAGYEPMVYCNLMWEAFTLDMSQLTAYPVWYADYSDKAQTPYRYEYWQYSQSGNVPGIEGPCDLDIQLIAK